MTAPVTGSVRLRFSATSPFVRKVRLVIHETGQADRVQHVYANPWGDFGGSVAAEADNLRTQNPLSRLPTLLTADGQPLYDSPVICEYLDSLHDATPVHPPADPAAANPPTNPHGGVTRWTALTWQALADGMLDAQMLRLNEFM
ncbi:MAG: glutathione S-transferase N-terminal domain-containing protein, partial [Alphaproteobacteria bacterium]